MPILHTRIAQQSAAFMSAGNRHESEAYNKGWVDFIGTNLMKNEEQLVANREFLHKNERANKAIKHKKMKE